LAEPATKFAFWGRCSTEDRQDPEASRAWQYSRADQLVAPRGGVIVAEYFDVDKSRSIPPARRPQAGLLLAAMASTDRGFDAVVVGEPQRAFYGNQFGNTFPLFEHWDVPLWVPEVGGPIDPANEAHDMIMSTFGSISEGERSRIKTRVRTTMAALAQTQGRFLGGRPPYGYMLIDAGPHPNPAKAADGKRLHTLAIDEEAAAVVQRIFTEFLAGYGIYAIAERLTRDGIPCPSAHDPGRNRHRCGIAWSKGAIRVILTNPRYTGRQVWNRQRKDEVLIDVTDVALGHMTKMRWNEQDKWIYSQQITHPPIISEQRFAQAQQILAGRGTGPTEHAPRRTPRRYTLRGLLRCGVCDRRMTGNWNNGQPYYRCRFPAEYALANKIDHPKVVYLREADITGPLDGWLTTAFAPARLDATIAELATHSGHDTSTQADAARARITEADTKIAQYKTALDAGGDAAVIGPWITQAHAQRAAAQAELRATSTPRRMNREEIAAMITALGDLVQVLHTADPDDKADVYTGLGLTLTYHPGERLIHATVRPSPDMCRRFVSEAGLAQYAHTLAKRARLAVM
jgi:site-specific DNA recombinase